MTNDRMFIAMISMDEDVAEDLLKLYDVGPGELLEREFGWLEESGFALEGWAIADGDVQWERYLRYLVDWAINHSSDEDEGKSPMTYKRWIKSNDIS